MINKQAVRFDGEFFDDMLITVSKRMKAGEKVDYIVDDIVKEFKLCPRELYVLRAELTKHNIPVGINDEVWYAPIERRSDFNPSRMRISRVYGSRSEDIQAEMLSAKASLRDIEQWLKENASARYLRPQSYYEKDGIKCALIKRMEDLKEAERIVNMQEAYIYDVSPTKPVMILGFETIDNTMYVIAQDTTGANATAVPPAAVSAAPLTDDLNKEESESTESKEWDIDIGSIKADNFIPTFSDAIMAAKNVPEQVKGAISVDEATSIDKKAYAMAVMENLKNSNWDENSEDKEESIRKISELFSSFGIDVKHASTLGNIKYADYKFPEKSIARALMTFDHIETMVRSLVAHEALRGNAKAAKALLNLGDAVKHANNYIRFELPTADTLNKEAAAIVLMKIANSLEELKDKLEDTRNIKQDHMGYVMAGLEPRIDRIASMLLTIEEE